MTTSDADLRKMFSEAYAFDHGPARWAAFDAVFRHADAAGNVAFGFRARQDTLSDLHHHGEYARALMAFSWCLATFDSNPEVTYGGDAHTLLWRYKWIIWELTQFAAVPLDRVRGLLDDMQRRYQAGGHSLHAVYQHRGLVAHHLGDLVEAGRWYGEMLTARRDSLSDCHACVPSGHVAYLAADGQYEEAVTVGSPYANGGCTEQPHWMLSELLLPYLKTDRLAEAANAHRVAYGRIRDSRHHLELIGLNVEFCGLTGNELYALPIIERHLPWLDRPSSPYAAMEFASAAALVLQRLVAAGQAESLISRRSDDGARRWSTTVAATQAELVTLARGLAAEFDARNANTYQSQRIETRLASAPIVAELPLSVLKGRPITPHRSKAAIDALVAKVAELTGDGDRAGAARTQLELAHALRNAALWSDATETAEEARRGLDDVGLVDDGLKARYLLVELYGRLADRAQVHTLVDELLAAPRLPESIPSGVDLLEQTANSLDGPRAVDQLERAAAIHRAGGDLSAEARCLRRAVYMADATLPAGSPVVARLDELIAVGAVNTDGLAELQDLLCGLQASAGQTQAALDRAERNADLGSIMRVRWAELLFEQGRLVEAEELGRRAIVADDNDDDDDDYDEDVDWRALLVVARSLRAQGRTADLAAFLDEHDFEEEELDEEY